MCYNPEFARVSTQGSERCDARPPSNFPWAETCYLNNSEVGEGRQNSRVLEATNRFLGFGKFRGNPGSVHIDILQCVVELKGSSTVVANECCRIGDLAYHEIEIL